MFVRIGSVKEGLVDSKAADAATPLVDWTWAERATEMSVARRGKRLDSNFMIRCECPVESV